MATLPLTPYGGAGPERMVRGVWGRDVESQNWYSNTMHNHLKMLGSTRTGELRLTDSSSALSAELVLNDDDNGRECAMLARRGVLKGLSSEFDIVAQLMAADGVRDVVRAAGAGLAVVNKPAYGQSQLSIRQAQAESTIIAGPAGSGKTQRARVLIAGTPGRRIGAIRRRCAIYTGGIAFARKATRWPLPGATGRSAVRPCDGGIPPHHPDTAGVGG